MGSLLKVVILFDYWAKPVSKSTLEIVVFNSGAFRPSAGRYVVGACKAPLVEGTKDITASIAQEDSIF